MSPTLILTVKGNLSPCCPWTPMTGCPSSSFVATDTGTSVPPRETTRCSTVPAGCPVISDVSVLAFVTGVPLTDCSTSPALSTP